ncbi:MAG TPA: bifunctional riboflavin kinase/FAD synthetase [Steroidobacteraceae bacterium]|nr:bifunctional riboflavin kinase/FAD synthetase [Steroidobacteraceae bacterium]
MRLLRGWRSAGTTGYVAAIGGFDGIHLGHRALLARTRELARAQGLASMVVSFEPLPKEYFAAGDPPARLTNFRERWRLLEQHGPDALWLLHFNARLRALHAAEFVALLRAGGVRHIVIGHDFRAGYRGEASAQWFRDQAPALGLGVEIVPPVTGAGVRVGSNLIREALVAGDLPLAAQLLGRPYTMRGRVVAGDRLGRQFGFPTANLRLARRRAPLDGIFAVRVRGAGHAAAAGDGTAAPELPGVASVGTRPTVGGVTPLLEVHLFDFAGDLYGRELEVEFVARLRDTLRFDDVEAMIAQMQRDAAAARAALAG